jgi:transcriptional regulator with XRE-family HTH domain
MRKSVYTRESALLAELLTEARKSAGLHQADLATRMGKDQTIISNIERGQRRVDVVEFYDYARATEHDPVQLFQKLVHKWKVTT